MFAARHETILPIPAFPPTIFPKGLDSVLAYSLMPRPLNIFSAFKPRCSTGYSILLFPFSIAVHWVLFFLQISLYRELIFPEMRTAQKVITSGTQLIDPGSFIGYKDNNRPSDFQSSVCRWIIVWLLFYHITKWFTVSKTPRHHSKHRGHFQNTGVLKRGKGGLEQAADINVCFAAVASGSVMRAVPGNSLPDVEVAVFQGAGGYQFVCRRIKIVNNRSDRIPYCLQAKRLNNVWLILP